MLSRHLCRLAALLPLIAVSVILAGILTACIENQGGQYRQIGERLGEMTQEGTAPGSYLYVAHMKTKEYWPNLPKYVNAIPADYRVYIKDGEALKEFKDYKPGPL